MPPSQRSCVACASPDVAAERAVNGFEIDACRACGLRFVPPELLTKVDYDQLYTEGGEYGWHVAEAGRMEEGDLIGFPRARRRTLDELRRSPPETLLEVGCGVGNFLRWTERMGIRCFGIDPSANATALARRSLAKSSIETGLLARDTFPGLSFDVICTWEVLEHVSDVNAFIDTIHARLNPGGRLYMSTPNYDCTYLWKDMERDRRSRPPVHVTFWNRASLQRLLDRRFVSTRIERLSVPANPAARSGGPGARWLVYPVAMSLPSQRLTLRSCSRKG